MLLELAALCVLAPGQVFVPSSGWTITNVQAAVENLAPPYADASVPTIVFVRRLARGDETMNVPAGCRDMKVVRTQPEPEPTKGESKR